MTKDQETLYKKWKKLVNMTVKELETFMKDWGDVAGLSREEAEEKGIRSGRDSARAIIRMKKKGVENWNKNDWEWAQAQVNFNTRTIGQLKYWTKKKGRKKTLFKKNGEPTRLHLALLVWGHDPYRS